MLKRGSKMLPTLARSIRERSSRSSPSSTIVRVIVGTSSARIAARASTSSCCILVVSTPISERCSSLISSRPKSAFNASLLVDISRAIF